MRWLIRLLLPLLLLWGGQDLAAQTAVPPAPRQWVTDTQGVLSPAARSGLNRRLALYEKATGHQVLVWIGGSLEGDALEPWAARTFESWGVGGKGKDDGLVLFILARDRKLRIEVGYGLEGQLPDALASRLIRETIAPELAKGNWDRAVEAGVDGILARLGGEARSGSQSSSRARANQPMSLGQKLFVGLLVLGFLVLLITNPSLALGLLFSLLSGGRGGGGGGGGGGWSGGGGRSGGGGASGSW
nr:TPM domain-containing protein [uncultured Holophaga sp.]